MEPTPIHADLLAGEVRSALERAGVTYEVIECDPDFADTDAFTKRYGFPLEKSANTILVASKRGAKRYAACVLLANTSLDVNRSVKNEMGVSKASFANAEETAEKTGMHIGGVTALALPGDIPVLVDARVMDHDWVIIGSGNRNSKLKVAPRVLIDVAGARVVEDLARPIPAP
jgi:prolyl-tRNA editing enzyme YbaK/EbsC (Cys-tRNA(Pro) deacylase)